MRKPQPLPASLTRRPFTVADADALGISRRRLRNTAVSAPGRGLRTLRNVSSQAELAGALSRVTALSAVSHTAAGWIWEFPHYLCNGDTLHISRPEGKPAVRRPGVVGHECRIFAGEVAVVDGVNVTTRERTWLDLAAHLAVDDLVVIADHLVRLPRPAFEGRTEQYCTQAQLQATIDRHPGKRGVRKARAALALSRVGADSPPETRLRLALLYAELPEPAVNAAVIDELGNSHHQPDLSYPEYRVGIEYEGSVHSDAEQVARDISRAERAHALGWTEVRISRRHMVNDARAAVAKVRSALVAAGWSNRIDSPKGDA
jgi:hypothetical protein